MGFQSQTTTDNTVIGVLSAALGRIGIDAVPIGSGRTDRGVHATRQVLHLDLPDYWNDPERLRQMMNLQLPPSIRIRRVEHAANDFHARYSARIRSYRYILRSGEPNPFEADFVTFVPHLDATAIMDAIGAFEGEHDFDFFKKSGSDTTHYVRRIFRAYAYSHRGYLILRFDANGFLRSQIRMMAAFLLRISEGKATREDLVEQLQCKARHSTDLAPHNGLYLMRIMY